MPERPQTRDLCAEFDVAAAPLLKELEAHPNVKSLSDLPEDVARRTFSMLGALAVAIESELQTQGHGVEAVPKNRNQRRAEKARSRKLN